MSEIRLSRSERLLAKLAKCLKQQETELTFSAGEIRQRDHVAQSLLAQCTHLEKLDVDLNVNYIEPSIIARFKRLRTLYLSGVPLGDWDFLAELPELRELNFRYHYEVQGEELDYSFLGRCRALESLALLFSSLRRVDFLTEMPQLRKLNLRCNAIESLDLPPLANLEDIDVGHNELINIDGLQHCPNLRRLTADDNQLTALPDLSHMQQLEYLDFSECRLADISQIGLLPQLNTAYLNHNLLTNIDILARQPKLEKVFFGRNPIQDPPPPAFIRMLVSFKPRRVSDFDNNPPPNLDKIWPLLATPDPANHEIAEHLARLSDWSPDDIAAYLSFAMELG